MLMRSLDMEEAGGHWSLRTHLPNRAGPVSADNGSSPKPQPRGILLSTFPQRRMLEAQAMDSEFPCLRAEQNLDQCACFKDKDPSASLPMGKTQETYMMVSLLISNPNINLKLNSGANNLLE
jgi:hypothetical protein